MTLAGLSASLLLLLAAAPPSEPPAKGNVYFAASRGALEEVRTLLDQGASANDAVEGGFTALMVASEQGHLPVVQLLLSRGADPSRPNRFGDRAINFAQGNGHGAIVALLKAAGSPDLLRAAEDRLSDRVAFLAGRTEPDAPLRQQVHLAFQLAHEAGLDDDEDEVLAVALGLRVLQPPVVRTVLKKLAREASALRALSREVARQDPDLHRRLFEAHAVRSVPLDVLEAAARRDDVADVRWALHRGAGQGQGQKNLNAALTTAASNGHTEVMLVLLQAGADLNAGDEHGFTALMRAAQNGRSDAARLLVTRGARVDQRSQAGLRAVGMASSHGYHDLTHRLLEWGAAPADKRTPPDLPRDLPAADRDLVLAAHEGRLEGVTAALARRANLKRSGALALTAAVERGFSVVAKSLLDQGVPPRSANANGYQPLHHAADGNFPETVEVLLAAGADVNARYRIMDDSSTPLMLAAAKGHLAVVKRLLDAGARVEIRNLDGASALTYAAREGHLEVVELLLARGATVQVLTTLGESPVELARDNGHRTVVQALERRTPRP